MRNSIGIEKKLSKKWFLFAETEFGFQKDISELDKIHGEIGIEYKPLKYLSAELKYRGINQRKNFSDVFKFDHMFAASVEVNYKLQRLKNYFRIKYQNIDDEFIISERKNSIKYRIKLKYDIRKTDFTPYFISEAYTYINEGGYGFKKIKFILGTEYKLIKGHRLKAYYRIDRELSSYCPYTYYTLGLAYTCKF
ncbi:MAG: DUF2490 domain-containing protein [Prolixibacteraceae bacterium]|nr:DUF2490 domain-containing protein [Prolixibacteraceae bacterium]